MHVFYILFRLQGLKQFKTWLIQIIRDGMATKEVMDLAIHWIKVGYFHLVYIIKSRDQLAELIQSLASTKVGCAFPMVISSDFRIETTTMRKTHPTLFVSDDRPTIADGSLIPDKVTDPNLFGEAYFWSLFKSFSHMLSIGYGVNTANVQTDMIGTIFALFVGKLVFALFLSQMISLIDSINMSEKIFKRHLQEVDDYLRFNRTPVPLKRAVKDFYEYHYK